MEYMEFPTGRLERMTVQAKGLRDDTLVRIRHPGEKLIEAITWALAGTETEKGNSDNLIWAGDRIDLSSRKRLEGGTWTKQIWH
ncbi:hypothetical protein ABW20_dc0110523 [Dactylellina cionopaga]|nr:hypothetical protein ABW20_dc0110523 [Dactylellina cionopaga]